MHSIAKYSWLLLFLVGLGFLYYAYYNIVTIPALDPADPAPDGSAHSRLQRARLSRVLRRPGLARGRARCGLVTRHRAVTLLLQAMTHW